MRIDYCQKHSKMCLPDNSFSDEGWKTSFEYDESVRSLFRRENRPGGLEEMEDRVIQYRHPYDMMNEFTRHPAN